MPLDADGPRPRSAAAVRGRERLVQVEVADVEAEIARPRDAEDGVEVGAVHVDLHALGVTDLGDVHDARLEHAERVRHRDHEGGDLRPHLARERVEVDLAVGQRLHLHDLVASQRRRRRVGAVRRVRDQHLGAPLAARGVIGPDHQHAGELALRARRRLQRDGVHAGDLAEHARQVVHQLEGALRVFRPRQRVQPREAGHARHVLVDLRVVLHRARAERVEVRVEPVVHARQPRVVAHHVELRDLRQRGRGAAQELLGQQLGHRPARHVTLGQREAHAPGRRELEDELVVGAHASTSASAAA